MNLNEFPMQNESKKVQGWRNNAAPMQMNTNNRTKNKNRTTPSSPSLKWKANQNSVINSVLQTGSSSRTCTTSTSNDSRVILALSEGRGEAACEVGIASIDLSQPKLILCQISDTQSYINTMTKINILNPREIVIPLTFVGTNKTNRLVEKVKEHFSDVKIIPIIRSAFNKNNGMIIVKNLCIPNMNSVLLILQNRYYALAAASGLLSYIENVLNVIYTTHSLKIQYQESEGSTIIDITTADKLELVACAKQPLHKQYSSLYSIMNFCLTKIGARTLRASILQPPSTKNEIESRLECVSELIERSGTGATFVLRSILTKIQNVDQLLNVVTLIPKQPQECSERQLNYLLLLNSFFEILEPLRECLREFKNPFYKEISDKLARPEFDYIKSLIRTAIVEDARPAKGSNGALQRCFAIKPGINSLLDLVRKTYSERLEEMRMYVKNLGEKHNLPLTLNNNNTKGYHIVLPLKKNEKKSFHRSMLPNEFIQVDRLSCSFTMKTTDLINLSVRVEEIMMNILKISNIIIHNTLINIKEHVALFYELCEDISKLDMFQSLAKLSGDTNYVKPKFDDYMEIKEGRHPILDFICSETPISNSIIATDDHNVHIISGPNGSGKSIFIRQLVLIQVMAQVGCYIPAESATLRIADRILARISLDDNPDIGVSAFVLEILEVEYFLEAMSKNTLIVVDELCRSTSVEEGTALAMAICEKLAETPAFVFTTTHFKAMSVLGDIYMNIKIWQMETIMEEKNGRVHFNFIYRLLEGMTALENYGVHIAKSCWPNDSFNYALEVLNNTKPKQINFSQYLKRNYHYLHLKYDLEADLRLLKKKHKLFPNMLTDKLQKYQNSLKNSDESIQIHVDDLKPQNESNRTIKFTEKSNSKVYNTSKIKGGMEQQKTSSSCSYVIQNTAKTSFGNSTPQNGDLYQTNRSHYTNEEENHISQSGNVPEYDQKFKSQITQRESIVDSIDYGDITFSGRPSSSINSQDDNEEEIDVRDVTFNWKPNQDGIGNNCFDYLGLYQNDSFQNHNFEAYAIDNSLVPLKNDEKYLLHPDPSSSIYSNDVMDCDETISELNKKKIKTISDHHEFGESNNSERQFKIPSATKIHKHSSEVHSKNDTSFLSVNEAQFSLSLMENRNKTSTPLQKNETMNYCNDVDNTSKANFVNYYNSNLNNNENSSFCEPKSYREVSKNDEEDFIKSELESYTEYFSDFNLEGDNDKTSSKNENLTSNLNKKATLNRCSITINTNDSQKLNPQEMESIISELESVSEYFYEWNDDQSENIHETNCVDKNVPETYCKEHQVSSISYSPDESILKDITENKPFSTTCSGGDNNNGESLFKIEVKRKKIKVPFRTPKPLVKKHRRPRRRRNNKGNKGINEDKYLTVKKSSRTNQEIEEKSMKTIQEVQILKKSPSSGDLEENKNNKKIIVLQNIVLNPSINLEMQSEISIDVESKGEINFINNNEVNQQRTSQKIKDKPITTENETDSLKVDYIQNPKVYNNAKNEKVQGRELLIEKSKSLSSEDFFKIETNTIKRRRLGTRQKRSKNSNTVLNPDQKSNLETKKNNILNKISNKDITNSTEDTKTYISSSQEIYHSANESFHEVQKSFLCSSSTSMIESGQSLFSATVRSENVKKSPSSKMLKRKKFISPLKLTRKEIKEEFEKQDKLMLENNCLEGYIQNILNRPSVESIQKSECVAMIYKTPQGGTTVVTPPPSKRSKKLKLRRFLPPIRDKPIQTFDVSLFSDKNADKFDKMMGIDRHNFSYDGSSYKLKVKKLKETNETTLDLDFSKQQTTDKNNFFTLDKMNKTVAKDEENSNLKESFELSKYFEEREESLSEFETFLSFDKGNRDTYNTKKNFFKRADNSESDIDSIIQKYLK